MGYVSLVPPMMEETGGFGENYRILSNRSTQNHVGEPRYFEINRVIVDSKKSFFSLYLSDTLDGRTTLQQASTPRPLKRQK
jgi:hypothetical protein